MASSTPFYQKLILWGALAATVTAALLVDDEAELSVDDVVQAVPSASESSAGRSAAGQTRQARQARQIYETLPTGLDQLGKRQFSAKADDIFAAASWEPERTVSAGFDEQAFQARQEEARRRVLPPSAPPVPFSYLGRVISEGRTRVFLAREDQNYVVGVGERINGEYRVDRIRKDVIELTYLPLGVRQALTIEQENPGRME